MERVMLKYIFNVSKLDNTFAITIFLLLPGNRPIKNGKLVIKILKREITNFIII